MRTNIVIDQLLMEQVLKIGGFKTKKEAVDQALRLFLQIKQQESVRHYRGKLRWDGNLDDLRTDK